MKAGTHLKKTRKINHRTYTLDRSSRKKSNAVKRAKNLREDGKTARIMRIGGMYRVYKGSHR